MNLRRIVLFEILLKLSLIRYFRYMLAALFVMLCADADAVNEDFVRAKQLIAQPLKQVKAQQDIIKDETAEVFEKVLA